MAADTSSPKVVIIGAGLGGLALALSLQHHHDISPEIFELREPSSQDGGYLALAPNACRVLDRIGVYEATSSQGYNYEELHFLSARNLSFIGTVWNGNQSLYGYKAVRVARSIVRRTLLDLAEQRGLEIHYEMKCESVNEDPQGLKAEASFANGQRVTADFIVGADGIHSRIRQFIDDSCIPKFSGQMGIGGPVDASKLAPFSKNMPMPAMIVGKENSFMFMPCTFNGDKVGVFATLGAEDKSREEWSRLMNNKARLAEMLRDRHQGSSEWPEVVTEACKNVDQDHLSLWPFYQVPVLKQWVSPMGRVIIIGDAAHGIPPTGGQGAAMAFEDAVTLSDLLVRLSDKTNADLKTSLDLWQDMRKARIEKVVAFTKRGGDVRKSSPSFVQQILKEWLMWAFFLIRGKEMGLGWMHAYDSRKSTEESR